MIRLLGPRPDNEGVLMAAPIFVADELVTATKMNQLPKGWLGSAKVIANQTGIVHRSGSDRPDGHGHRLPAGRRVKVTGYLIVQQLTAGLHQSGPHIPGMLTQIGQATASLAVNDFYHVPYCCL